MKNRERVNAENAIRFEVEFDTNIEKRNIIAKGATQIPYFTACIEFWFMR